MSRRISQWGAIFFLGLAASAGAQVMTPPAPVSTPTQAESLYHQALEAYLDGNYDQAILWTAQSLQDDPNFEKSKNLLSVLTTEKETEGKTVIWLSGKPVVVSQAPGEAPAPVPSGDFTSLEGRMKQLQARFNNYAAAQSHKNTQVDGQIQVIQNLVQSSQANGYDDLKKSQIEIYQELKKVESGRAQDLRLLYALCAVSLLFSGAAIWKKGRKSDRA